MAIRLNGWQRIGVVLSALWLIVFLFWGLNDFINGRGTFIMGIPDHAALVKVGCSEVPPTQAEAAKGWGATYLCPLGTELPEHYEFNTAGFTIVMLALKRPR